MTLSAHHFQTNRLDLLSRLAGDISHEIKNPLHAMVINLELVRRKVEKGESAAALERVGIVEDEIRKVHALANALLESLRPPRDAQASCAFARIFDELQPLVAARARCARVDLQIEAEPSSMVVALAPNDVRLLVLNIADRAVRAASPNGVIALTVRQASGHLDLDVLSATPTVDETEDGWLRDHPVDVDRIDLGLRVVRDLVDRIGGRIQTAPAADGRHRLSLSLPGAGSA